MNVIYIAGASFLGAVAFALLGWVKSNEAWDTRKFMGSVIRAVIGAVGYATAYHYIGRITIIDCGIAFVAGTGFDTAVKAVGDAVVARMK